MAKGSDKNYVSVWFWLFAFFIMAIPLVNLIMTLVWAVAGENQSRKNYFRAILFLWFLAIVFFAVLFSLGLIPLILQKVQSVKIRA